MKSDDKKKTAPEKFDRSDLKSGGNKPTKNPATTNNEPFDEGQWETPNKLPAEGEMTDEDKNNKEDETGEDKRLRENFEKEKGDLSI